MYETGSFVPIAKIVNDKCFSIISDYVGRPIQAYDNFGKLVWETEYDIYGNLRNLQGDRNFVPFRQLGQYEDVETGLYYNRFRYYDCNTGTYISKDPISILGGLNVYAYVKDTNIYVDIFGLIDLYRGMVEALEGPFIYSGQVISEKGLNPANSLGIRPDESGMSTNSKIENILPHRKSPEFGGTNKKSTMYVIDSEVLDKYGLVAINDSGTHYEIRTKKGIPASELPERLAKTQKEWKKVCP